MVARVIAPDATVQPAPLVTVGTASRAVGWVTCTLATAEQLLASRTVTVYVPAIRLVAVAFVLPLVHW